MDHWLAYSSVSLHLDWKNTWRQQGFYVLFGLLMLLLLWSITETTSAYKITNKWDYLYFSSKRGSYLRLGWHTNFVGLLHLQSELVKCAGIVHWIYFALCYCDTGKIMWLDCDYAVRVDFSLRTLSVTLIVWSKYWWDCVYLVYLNMSLVITGWFYFILCSKMKMYNLEKKFIYI